MNLTKAEAIKHHRELWGWLAENPMKQKYHWPEMEKYRQYGKTGDEEPNSNCFCCEYVFQQTNYKKRKCDLCPIVWPDKTCMNNGLWGKWDAATLPEEKSRLAALIRDLPEKEEPKPAPKFKIGDKVVPISTSTGYASLQNSCWDSGLPYGEQGKKQGYLYVTYFGGNGSLGCWPIFPYRDGDYFLESDLIPYVEPKKGKFKIGDIVTGNAKNDKEYFMTLSNMIYGEVFEVPKNGRISLKILKTKDGEWIGKSFHSLLEDCFELIQENPQKEIEPEPVKDKQFKVGDRVRVKDNIKIGDGRPSATVVSNMLAFAGQVTTISKINSRGLYALVCDNGEWDWTDEMVEPLYKQSIEGTWKINHAPENKTITESETYIFSGNKTTCIIEIDGKKWKGCAHCDPADEWDEQTGKQWAQLRANRKMLDAVEKELRK